MATIEPRLIHLLNTVQSPDSTPIDLPTLPGHVAPPHDPSLSLAPIEDEISGGRRDRAAPQQIPPIRSIASDFPPRQDARPDGPHRTESANISSTHAAPIHQLLGPDDTDSVQLPSFSQYIADPTEDAATKKRQRALTVHQDIGPLPQPLKKRKSTQQVVPPIISGLHEPPVDAAVFPPINLGHYDDANSSNLTSSKDYTLVDSERQPPAVVETAKSLDKSAASSRGRAQRRSGKRRRKWSDEETSHLLLGVHKHGVGRWTLILEDQAYKFNDRTAGDLKDRFRTCCPAELRDTLKLHDSHHQPSLDQLLNNHDNLLDDGGGDTHDGDLKGPSSVASTNQDSDSGGAKKPKGRAHRKKIEDLEALGINTPFKKSERRERRPFTSEDDNEILEGLRLYGPSWTKIQRDMRFHLKNRQPTDLRDRVRNKFPEVYASIDKDKATFQSIQHGRGTTRILEPSVDTSVDNSFQRRLPRTSSRESISRPKMAPSNMMDSFESLPGISSFDIGDSVSAPNGDEMAISRLMIEEEPRAVSDRRGGILDDWATGVYSRATADRQSSKTGTERDVEQTQSSDGSYKPFPSSTKGQTHRFPFS